VGFPVRQGRRFVSLAFPIHIGYAQSIMFTGIIQYRARVAEIRRVDFGIKMAVDTSGWSHKATHGESICVSGVCLTCTKGFDAETGGALSESNTGDLLTFDIIAQTLRCTTLGDLKVGDPVNLEPCVTPESLMSGHIVQGHVDGVGTVEHRHDTPDEVRLTIRPPEDLLDYIVPKGSVTADGVSMTLAESHEKTFELALIPTTIDLTTLGLAQPDTRVNLEADIITKTIVHVMKRMNEAE